MRLVRQRGIMRHYQRNFAEERGNLQEGYQNYKKMVQESFEEIANSDAYSPEQKVSLLNAYKEDLLQKKADYKEELGRLNTEEALYCTGTDAESYYCPATVQRETDGYSGYEGAAVSPYEAQGPADAVDAAQSEESASRANDCDYGM